MSELTTDTHTSPYKGLIPYSEEDAPFFFGREQKREIIHANLLGSRLTVLHGPSGVGKSSVLRAGVAHQLRQVAQQSLDAGSTPEFAIIVFSSWRDDPVVALANRVRESVGRLTKGKTLDPLPPSRDLTQSLQTWTKFDPDGHRPDLDLLIILDQFEEYFLYHPKETGPGSFVSELARAINSPDLRVNFLISIREDALAKLECFKGSVTHLFENRLSIEHLDRKSARKAIISPIDQYNKLCLAGREPMSIERSLVETILDQIRTGQVVIGQAGRGTVETGERSSTETTQIETPYLQMVMTRLWEEEIGAGSRVLRHETLNRLGGAANIVRTHLDKTMMTLTSEEQDTASRIFYHLVTPGGTKIAHTVPDLAAFAKISETELQPVLRVLSDKARMLRPVDPAPNQQGVQRYEIFHDVLAPAILDWRMRYMQGRNQAKAEKQAAKESAKREKDAATELRVQQAEELAESERLRAQEERRRFEAERQRAEEQKRRFEAEAQRAAEQKRRMRQLRLGFVGLSVLLMATLGSTAFALRQWGAAELAQAEADTQRAEEAKQRNAAQDAQGVAVAQTAEAKKQRAEAENQTAAAKIAEAEATKQRNEAERLRGDAVLAKNQLAERNSELALRNTELGTQKSQLAITNTKLASTVKELDIKRAEAESRELAAHAISQLRYDPHVALLLAIEAMGRSFTKQAKDALQQSYLISNERAVLSGHKDRVWNAAFSSDDKFIVTSSDDRTARIWDTSTYIESHVLEGHTGRVFGLAIGPTGKLIATEAMDNTAKVWNALSGEELFTLPNIGGSIAAIAFNRDGKLLAVESSNVARKVWEAAIWDTKGRKEVARLRGHKEEISAVTFSPKKNLVATASWDKTAMVWNAETGKIVAEMPRPGEPGHDKVVNSVAFSPDGKWIVTASDDKTARVWEAETGQSVAQLTGHGGAVQSADFSPDGKFIVTASRREVRQPIKTTRALPAQRFTDQEGVSEGTTARVFDAVTGRRLAVMRGHTDDVYSAKFSPDGKFVVTASADGTASVWETRSGLRIAELRGHTGPVYSAAFDSLGKVIVTASADGTVRVWEPSLRRKVVDLEGHIAPVKVSFDRRDGSVITADRIGIVQVWDPTTGKNVDELRGDNRAVFDAALSSDRKLIVTASRDPQQDDVRQSLPPPSTARPGQRSTPGQPSTPISTPQPTPSPDVMARIWKASGESVGELAGHTKRVNSVAFSPDGTYVVTGSEDNTARVWNVQTRTSVATLNGHNKPVLSAEFNFDSNLVVTASSDGTARVWDVATRHSKVIRGGIGEMRTATFSPDGKFIVTGSADGTAGVWDVATGASVVELRGHTGPVHSASFSTDGKYLVTASEDGTARVWEAATGELITALQGEMDDVYSAALSPGNKFVALGSMDGTAQVFTCEVCRPDEELLNLARTRGTRKLTPEQRASYNLSKP